MRKIVGAYGNKDGAVAKLFEAEEEHVGRFVCVGNSRTAYYSLDGINWAAMEGLPTTTTFKSMCYGNGRFVCNDANKVYYSVDGMTWNPSSTVFANTMDAILYDGNRFMLFNINSGAYEVWESVDGDTWTKVVTLPSDMQISVQAMIYAAGVYVATGSRGKCIYSTDGINWSWGNGLDTSINSYASLSYNNGIFVAMSSSTYAFYSTDGITWSKSSTIFDRAMYSC